MIESHWVRLRAISAAIDESEPRADWGDRICAAAVACLDGVDAVSVPLRLNRDSVELFGSSDAWAAELEDIQFDVGEGPGLDAFFRGEPVYSDAATA
ncbi:hypothetical protein [Nocardia sp. CC201C]|uniref:hypothetical protein n=1 Tax=Nocardia sp. CC201C TaxID=3044575 RepID=UPI0024A85779|nr:hypothetical protein [Nocardia sp. CC201C]